MSGRVFWAKLRGSEPADDVPRIFRHALEDALPKAIGVPVLSRRRAGVGSLGRPRIVALVDDAGGPIAREAKALLPSCWQRDGTVGECLSLARKRYRCPDPFLHVDGSIILRRLAPNSRKIDLKASKRRLNRRLIEAMARDLGAIHAADPATAASIEDHMRTYGHAWLSIAATTMAAATRRDWTEYREATRTAKVRGK